MDLALDLGLPLSVLREMPERDLYLWRRYAARKMLPAQRMEWYLAQVAYFITAVAGSKAQFTDFLLNANKEPDPDDELEEAKEAFEFKPRRRQKA